MTGYASKTMKLAFESWARPKWAHREDFDQRIKAKPGTYNNFEVQAAWEAWQAALSQQPATPEPVVGVGQSKNRHWSAALADDLVASGDVMRECITTQAKKEDE